MLKKINRVLKLVGLNLVRAKRKAPKSEARRVKEFIDEFVGPRPSYTREELENVPLKCAVNQPGAAQEWQTLERYTPEDKVPLADYMGDSEWHNSPGPTGNVGCCGEVGPLGPSDGEGVRGPVGPVGAPHLEFDRQSTPCSGVSTPCFADNVALGAAALLSVDCGTENMCFGAPDHEITRAEHFDTAGGTTPEQNEARFETPRVQTPNSDNKITGPTS